MMTLSDFYANGKWDCGHAWDYGDHFDAWVCIGRPTDREASINVVRAAWQYDDDVCADWIAQQDWEDAPCVDPKAAYHAWRDGWQARAARYVEHYMATEWKACEVCGGVAEGNACCG